MPLRYNRNVVNQLEKLLILRGNMTLDRIAGTAKEIAPRRSGDLRDGITVLKYFSSGSLYGEVGVVNVFYAPFVHFGTKFMPARPFLLQAFDREAPGFISGDIRGFGIGFSPANYQFPPERKQYTYLRPGEAPPPHLTSSGINFLPVTGARTIFNSAS